MHPKSFQLFFFALSFPRWLSAHSHLGFVWTSMPGIYQALLFYDYHLQFLIIPLHFMPFYSLFAL